MNEKFVADRITQLRMEKGISEQKMSYELGRSKTYIWNLGSLKSHPSISSLLEICEYFEITPAQFFEPMLDEENFRILRLLSELDSGDKQTALRIISALRAERIHSKEHLKNKKGKPYN